MAFFKLVRHPELTWALGQRREEAVPIAPAPGEALGGGKQPPCPGRAEIEEWL